MSSSVQLHSVEKELKSTGLTTLLQRKVFAYHYTDVYKSMYIICVNHDSVIKQICQLKACPNGKCFTVKHAKTCFRLKHVDVLQSGQTA